ncbi:ABC transporter permease [Sphaerisporangium album]|uniref:ABC transporter permease n=1 Tax=Sphaerisporangium album TaxID=509200 RepID=A0A367FFS5_9ACTN|nr:ABC transporter permease subunit [Sphaerisporangium album]RCG28537.1 ABC transporter permease [Sphaerisporangium album]
MSGEGLTQAVPAGEGAGRSAADVVASEWIKLRSVRSTSYVLGAAALIVVLTALLTWQAVSAWDGLPAATRARWKGIAVEEYFLPFVQLVIGVLGVIAITGEYSSGMIRTSLVAVPRRGRLLVGKAVALAAVSLVAGTAVLFAVVAVEAWIVGDRAFPGHPVSLAAKAPLLVCMGLSVMVVALVGFGLGTLTRSTAAAIVAVAGLTFVLPALALGVLPEPWGVRVAMFMPANLPDQLAGWTPDEDITQGPFARSAGLPPLAALAALAAYVVVFVGTAALRFSRSDA